MTEPATSQNALPAPRAVTRRQVEWALVALFILLGTVLRVASPSTIYFNIHAERDVWRTIEILEGERFPHTGSELTQGGYTLGPALYFLQIPPLLVTLDPRGLLVWLALLHAAGLWVTWRIGKEFFSRRAGLYALALFATFPLAVLALRYLWNPSYIFPFSALFYWALFGWVLKGKVRRLPALVLAACVLFQVHLSAALLIVLAGACWAIFRPRVGRRWLAVSGGVALLVFAPYIAGELRTGLWNTRQIINPPDALITANEAHIPILDKQRLRPSEGAMMALQVALSPLFYDRRFETGSFSYLHLLAEHGPVLLPQGAWEVAFLLHRLRWGYIFLCGLAGLGLLGTLLLAGKYGRIPALWGEASPLARRRAALLILSGAILTVPPLLTSTMATDREGQTIGVGAIRYYFILYPLPFLVLGWFGSALERAGVRAGLRVIRVIVPAALAAAVFLQVWTVGCYLVTAREMHRSFKYSLYEAYDWRVQREAARILVEDWGVTEEQFVRRMDTLDHTFTTQRWDVPSLEQGLDYAFYTQPHLGERAEPLHPDSFFLLYDERRTPEPDLQGITVLDEADAGGLILLRVAEGEERDISPIQNTWERLRRPRRLE